MAEDHNLVSVVPCDHAKNGSCRWRRHNRLQTWFTNTPASAAKKHRHKKSHPGQCFPFIWFWILTTASSNVAVVRNPAGLVHCHSNFSARSPEHASAHKAEKSPFGCLFAMTCKCTSTCFLFRSKCLRCQSIQGGLFI